MYCCYKESRFITDSAIYQVPGSHVTCREAGDTDDLCTTLSESSSIILLSYILLPNGPDVTGQAVLTSSHELNGFFYSS